MIEPTFNANDHAKKLREKGMSEPITDEFVAIRLEMATGFAKLDRRIDDLGKDLTTKIEKEVNLLAFKVLVGGIGASTTVIGVLFGLIKLFPN